MAEQKKAKPKGKKKRAKQSRTHARDAISGKYVTPEEADAHPETTVKESTHH